jgi:hypothetical protein
MKTLGIDYGLLMIDYWGAMSPLAFPIINHPSSIINHLSICSTPRTAIISQSGQWFNS